MNTSTQKQSSHLPEFILAGGYLVFFCLFVIVCSAAYFLYIYNLYSREQIPPVNVLATNLPPRTPTAHITSFDFNSADVIFEENFDNNDNTWTDWDAELSDLEISNGELIIQSQSASTIATARCEFCPYLEEPYYLQVDFRTATSTDVSFGIKFNIGRIDDIFYLLDINTESKVYTLYHHTLAGWFVRLEGESSNIRPFPETNTLGIYANSDMIEIYANGNLIDTYTESGATFHEGFFGLVVDDLGLKLIADNLILVKAGE